MALKEITDYHERTKHHFDRFAKSHGYMDWANQPNPFRKYSSDEPPINLPLLASDPEGNYRDLYKRDSNGTKPFSLQTIGGFLELSLGLSAWKKVPASRWSLRINPSSGNLHPTEAHLILPSAESISPGIYHYNSFYHQLEPRAKLSSEIVDGFEDHFGARGFVICLSSVFWRESWKYGERAFRYCNHDAGHALACLSFSGNLFGWKVVYLDALSDEEIERLFGFDKTPWPKLESEHPDMACYVFPARIDDIFGDIPKELIESVSDIEFFAAPNALSEKPFDWEIIREAAEKTRKPKTAPASYSCPERPCPHDSDSPLSATQIIRRRRSALSFDPEGSLARDRFFSMLDKTIARDDAAPFDVRLGPSYAHLLLFVHRVTGLDSGLYFFVRNSEDLDELERITRPEFLWEKVEPGFDLYLLRKGNHEKEAATVGCYQDIAGSSAFSLAMIVKFSKIVKKWPYLYRHLFWETGMIGQVLYLEAEAAGVRATGIGCFFDDPVHEILGFSDNRYQSLYHFTVGTPVEDRRLVTLEPYYHLERLRQAKSQGAADGIGAGEPDIRNGE